MLLHKDAENTMNWSSEYQGSLKENENKIAIYLESERDKLYFWTFNEKRGMENLTPTGHFVAKKQIVKQ